MGPCKNIEACSYKYCRKNKVCYLQIVEARERKESVIHLVSISKPRWNAKINKKTRILKKTDGKCYICENKLTIQTMTVDHFIPKSKGGTNNISNLFPACRKCNQDKADQNPL